MPRGTKAVVSLMCPMLHAREPPRPVHLLQPRRESEGGAEESSVHNHFCRRPLHDCEDDESATIQPSVVGWKPTYMIC